MSSFFDICVVCALPEEARAFIQIVENQCSVSFQTGSSSNSRDYRYTTIRNKRGEPLSLHVSWPPNMGLLEMGLHFKPILQEFRPHLAAMTGICAGDRLKTTLGDLVVADRAFIYDAGKFDLDEHNRQVHLYDTSTSHSARDILQFVRLFDGWQEEVAKLPRPSSKHQQRDWLLNQLLDPATPRVADLWRSHREGLNSHAPAWRKIVQELQQGSEPFLTMERAIRDPAQIEELNYHYDFPFTDPALPQRHIAPMASGNAVRSDNPFADVRFPVRNTIAIEMEGAAFYQAVEDLPDIDMRIRSLLVKGVCDYADAEKDDSYHAYASQVSALYMLSFIREFVTSDRMRIYGVPAAQITTGTQVIAKQDLPPTGSAAPAVHLEQPAPPESVVSHAPPTPLLFFSHAPKDKIYREELEKHLALLKRSGRIDFRHSGDVQAGQEYIRERDHALRQARMIVLLLSPDFGSSPQCQDELELAYEVHATKQVPVIPVLVRPASWKELPFGKGRLGGLQSLPRNARPVIGGGGNMDHAFQLVADEIRAVIDQILPPLR